MNFGSGVSVIFHVAGAGAGAAVHGGLRSLPGNMISPSVGQVTLRANDHQRFRYRNTTDGHGKYAI